MEARAQDAEAVALAVRVMAEARHVTVKPVVGMTTEPRPTVPAKLKVLVRLTDMAVPVAPELKLTGVPTDIAKSPTWTTEEAE